MMEGTPRAAGGRFGCTTGACGAGAASGWSLLFENIATCLDELFRVSDGPVIPHFIMDVRACAAARGAEPAYDSALVDLSSRYGNDFPQMSVAGANAIAVIDF